MSERTLGWLCKIYLFCALVTFGYSYNADFWTDSRAAPGDVQLINTISAGFKAGLWPLYWSVKAFESVRPKP